MEKKLETSQKILEFLEQEGVNPQILRQIRAFLDTYPGADSERIPVPRYAYYGKEVWEQALTAILCGKNLLLAGGKATGKNVLAQNLAALFLRPMWNISLHVNTDAASLVGTDTFQDGAVTFRPGPVYQCGAQGFFGGGLAFGGGAVFRLGACVVGALPCGGIDAVGRRTVERHIARGQGFVCQQFVHEQTGE